MDTDAHNTTHKAHYRPIPFLEFLWSVQIKNSSNHYVHGARVEVIMA